MHSSTSLHCTYCINQAVKSNVLAYVMHLSGGGNFFCVLHLLGNQKLHFDVYVFSNSLLVTLLYQTVQLNI